MEGVPRDTLVQYDSPQEINELSMHKRKALHLPGKKKGNLPPLDTKLTTEDYLNSILPPREWSKNGKNFIQFASSHQSSRQDVVTLKENLDEKLKERHAKDLGVCPVKEELFSQCFDEIIRQITIKCPERGLILMKVRDEIKMTTGAYKTLYENSVIFGSMKQMQSEEGKDKTLNRINQLEAEKIRLENQKIRVLKKKDALLRKFEENRLIDDQKRIVEKEFWDKQNEHLDEFCKRVQNMGN
jgi:dynein light intermediate chain